MSLVQDAPAPVDEQAACAAGLDPALLPLLRLLGRIARRAATQCERAERDRTAVKPAGSPTPAPDPQRAGA